MSKDNVKVKRKMWIMFLRSKYNFEQIVSLAGKFNLEVIKAFKPDMMVDIHMGVKGKPKDISLFKEKLIAGKCEITNRCPKRSFQFEI